MSASRSVQETVEHEQEEKLELSFQKLPEDFAYVPPQESKAVLAAPPGHKKPIVQTFESAEHMTAASLAFDEFLQTLRSDVKTHRMLKSLPKHPNKSVLLPLSDTLSLTPGQIAALAFDFYGEPKLPVCFGKNEAERLERFENVYNSLAKASSTEIHKLIDRIERDAEAIKKAMDKGESVKVTLLKRADKNNIASTLQTLSVWPHHFFHSRYVDLAQMNFDHFGKEARIVYETGHKAALISAKKAFEAQDAIDKKKLFLKALTLECIALHPLKDSFSAGHIRTPRKALYDQVNKDGFTVGKTVIAGLLAKQQHDEDSRNGLLVESDQSVGLAKTQHEKRYWTALGDDCYFEDENADNARWMKEAIIAAFKDIYHAYQGSNIANLYTALSYMPRAVEQLQPGYNATPTPLPPLFKLELDGYVSLRTQDPHDPKKFTYPRDQWNPTLALFHNKYAPTLTKGAAAAPPSAEALAMREQLRKGIEDLANEKDESLFSSCRVM